MMTDIAVVSDWVRQAKDVVAFTGAGISTPSGIPDFRSENSGLWEKVDPQMVASIYGFRKNPQAFYDWVRPLAIRTLAAQPNAAHLALFELEKMGKLSAVVTQNIDMLHTRAGNSVVYELHGHLRKATCISCFEEYLAEPIIAQVLEDGHVPRCPTCDGVIKPNVILFGEQLPYDQMMKAKKCVRSTDLLLAMGSSLEVAPASDIPLIAKRNGAKLVILNLEPTIMDKYADIVILGDVADTLPRIVANLKSSA